MRGGGGRFGSNELFFFFSYLPRLDFCHSLRSGLCCSLKRGMSSCSSSQTAAGNPGYYLSSWKFAIFHYLTQWKSRWQNWDLEMLIFLYTGDLDFVWEEIKSSWLERCQQSTSSQPTNNHKWTRNGRMFECTNIRPALFHLDNCFLWFM